MKSVNFGIDLGTTNSLIAKYDNGRVALFRNPVGHKESLPSVVAFRKERTLVGDKAREYLLKDTVNVFGGFKRRMGSDDRFYVVNIDENVTPVELSAHVLKELKQFVHTGEPLDAAVITIPASFDVMQANATQKAGNLAGFSEVFLLQEPIAAALAYFNNERENRKGNWLVYDLGGGTFDIALVEISDGEMKVKDHEGNNFLGGVDFDTLMVEKLFVPHIVKETGIADFAEQLTVKYGKYESLFYRLLYHAEEIKKELTVQNVAEVDFSAEIDGRVCDFFFTVTAEQFNELITSRVQETVKMLHAVLERNFLKTNDVHEIILVGGSTLIPYVRATLQETGIRVNTGADPITAIAVGAAFYAANKNYEPSKNTVETKPATISSEAENTPFDISQKPADVSQKTEMSLQINLGYSKMSRRDEEVLVMKVTGLYENHTYRITRSDGGFDTGVMPLKARVTEFLPLLPDLSNKFTLRVFDASATEIQTQYLHITHGQYSTSGQPLSKDICIEIDDMEINGTRLEAIFERNSILPLKKTLYREISKTVAKGSDESIIINILEGDRYARSISNLPIGCIEISGKELTSDLFKGSDIEIQISISDNREITVETFLVMTQQEFKNTFSVSERKVNVARLKEQYAALEKEIRDTLKQFNAEGNQIWAIHTENLLRELENHGKNLSVLQDNDSTDRRYVIAEAVSRISQEFDKIGGYERLETLRDDYFRLKEALEQSLQSVDEKREALTAKYRKFTDAENMILQSRNPAILQRCIERLDDLYFDVLWNNNSYVVSRLYGLKYYPAEEFKNYRVAQQTFAKAEKAIDESRYLELRHLVNNLFGMLVRKEKSVRYQPERNFKGTGIK